MKKLLQQFVLPAALFITAFANAQTSGGPDAFGYTWKNNNDPNGPAYNWVDISSRPGTVTVQGLQDDNIKGPFSMAIPFRFYWYNPSKFWIGSNGYLGFTNGTAAHPFPTIPSTPVLNDWIAVMASDLTFTDANVDTIPGARCQFWQGNDTLIVTWESVPFWDDPSTTVVGYSGLNSFEVILSAVDSSITCQYKAQIGTYNPNPINFMEMGIENNSGTIGLQNSHDTYPPTASAIKYYYPDTVTLAINDASTTYVNNAGSHGQIMSINVPSYTSIAEVKNTGNQTLASFDSYSRVVNAASIIQVRDTITITNLGPGGAPMLIYPDTWTPTIAGLYRHINTTILAGDATPNNNADTLEIWAIDQTLATISLQWDNGVSSGTSIGWLGGGGGVAQHFVPSFYPVNITAIGSLVVSDISSVGYSLQVYADDGINGAPGTFLDSIFVFPGEFVPGVYYEIPTTTALPINTGGFYVAWMMGGPDIQLGQDASTPHAHQSYEILGPANNPANWSVYRDQLNDPIIHAVISGTTGIAENSSHSSFGVYPNPAHNKFTISVNKDWKIESGELTIQNMLGAEVYRSTIVRGKSETINCKLPAGVYLVKINSGENTAVQKLVIE